MPAPNYEHAPVSWRTGFLPALLAPLFVTLIGNLDGLGQLLRNLAGIAPTAFQSSLPGLKVVVDAAAGIQQVAAGAATLPVYNFWDPSRVIPYTINEFPYWSFLFADLHPHLIGIPLAGLFLALALALIEIGDTPWRAHWRYGLGLLAAFALLLGTMAAVNLWELPTYFGLGVLAFLISQFRGHGRIHWGLSLLAAALYAGGAYVLYLPFFRSYVNVGASGVGLVHAPDTPQQWLLIWGFLGFLCLSWLLFAATRPARRAPARGVRATRVGEVEGGDDPSARGVQAMQVDEIDADIDPARDVRVAQVDEAKGSNDPARGVQVTWVSREDAEPDAEQEGWLDTEPDTEPDSDPDAEGGEPSSGQQQRSSDSGVRDDLIPSPAHPVTPSPAQPSGIERAVSLFFRRYDRLPRAIYLHRQLVQRPTFFYLLLLGLIVGTAVLALGAALLGWTVLALCLLPLGLAFALLWRRGPEADGGSTLATTLTITGLALLAGTQLVYLKDFLGGGEYYRMNTLFKFFNQVWVMWGVAAAIAVPRIWHGWVSSTRSPRSDVREASSPARLGAQTSPSARVLRWAWAAVFALLLLASLVYPFLGTPTRLDTRMVGWRPPIGTLNALDFMREGSYTWPDESNPMDLRYEYEALQWLLDNVRGNRTILESSETDYYRAFGTKIASYTGLSGVNGFHEGEQRYGEDTGYRSGLHREIWDTPDLARTQQIIDELRIDLIYVGQLERYLHPGGAAKFEQMAANGQLSIIFQNERVTIYATNWFVPQG